MSRVLRFSAPILISGLFLGCEPDRPTAPPLMKDSFSDPEAGAGGATLSEGDAQRKYQTEGGPSLPEAY